MSPPAWMVSLPYGGGNKDDVQQGLLKSLRSDGAKCYSLDIPPLRVGTLDTLLILSDEMVRHDTQLEGVASKVLKQLEDLTKSKEPPEVTLSDNSTVPMASYLAQFEWDFAQYSKGKPLRDLISVITDTVGRLDDEIKSRNADFMVQRSSLATMVRKEEGSLMVRSLASIVKDEDIVDSEYLTTVLVIVPRYMMRDWTSSYDSLNGIEYIVPNSSKLLREDNDFALYSVVVFKKVEDEFRQACRESRFTPREFELESTGESGLLEKAELEDQVKRQMNELIRFLKASFSVIFTSWFHLKCIRLYVESILRYGLPPRFLSMMIYPTKKSEKKLRDKLKEMCRSVRGYDQFGEGESTGSGFGAGDFYPYVFFTVSSAFAFV